MEQKRKITRRPTVIFPINSTKIKIISEAINYIINYNIILIYIFIDNFVFRI